MIGWFLLCAVISFIFGKKVGEAKNEIVQKVFMSGMIEVFERVYEKFKSMNMSDEEICNIMSGGKGSKIMFHVEQIRKERKEKSA